MKRSTALLAGFAGVLMILTALPGVALSAGLAAGTVQRLRLTVGHPRPSLNFLPLYLAAEQTAALEGLGVDIVAFGSGSRVAAALASDSVHIAAASLSDLIGMIAAGQPAKAFYAGVFHADFEWIAVRGIRTWSDLRGKSLGISTHGSLSDFLTRYALRGRGLEAGTEVRLVQAGEAGLRFAALKAGRVDASVLLPPFTWYAEEQGFVRLGSQAAEIAEAWPRVVLFTKEKLLADHPGVLRAFLRAYVRAIRLARTNREVAVQTLTTRLKFEQRHAERAYAEAMAGFDERGRLPVSAMPVFWKIALAAGDVRAPWPETRFLERRFIDTFDEWAPK